MDRSRQRVEAVSGPRGQGGGSFRLQGGGQNYFIYLQKQDLLDRTFKDNTEFFVKIYLYRNQRNIIFCRVAARNFYFIFIFGGGTEGGGNLPFLTFERGAIFQAKRT